jgi:hypothetical protein
MQPPLCISCKVHISAGFRRFREGLRTMLCSYGRFTRLQTVPYPSITGGQKKTVTGFMRERTYGCIWVEPARKGKDQKIGNFTLYVLGSFDHLYIF